VILGTAGHIDHGKTALVRALTGIDTDRLPEEKRRGITIDLGFAPLEIDGAGTIGIVDVPGHEGFVKTMLAGASGIDVALLVVAGDEGIMPQTREHLEILSLLRIPRCIIALTKCDIVEPEWLDLVADDVRALVRRTRFRDAHVVAVSAVTGAGIEELKREIASALREAGTSRDGSDLFRMPVDRAFTVNGTGTVVTGTIWSGSIRKDATVIVQPAGISARVRGIQSHARSVEAAGPGTRAALALGGCDLADVGRGSTIVLDSSWTPTREIDSILSFSSPGFRPTPRTRVRVHIGTGETGARLSQLRAGANNEMSSRLVLDEPIMARGGDAIVLRLPSPAGTIGGGEVLDPYPPRIRRRQGPVDRSSERTRIEQVLEAAAAGGASIGELPIRTGLSPREIAEGLRSIDAVVIGDRAWASEIMALIETAIEEFISRETANHPLEAGVSLQTVRASVRAHAAVMDLALDRLSKRQVIETDGSIARPFGWVSRLGEREQALSDAILHEICIGSFEPPSVGELSARFGGLAPALLRRLERAGSLERVSDDRYYDREALSGMIETMRSRLETARIYSPAELREVLGVSRKYLIPFLEFCDRKGVTERSDGGRAVRATPDRG